MSLTLSDIGSLSVQRGKGRRSYECGAWIGWFRGHQRKGNLYNGDSIIVGIQWFCDDPTIALLGMEPIVV